MRNLSDALVIREEIKNDKRLFFWYEIEEEETPESVAFDFYGRADYNFVVLLMNDMVDPFFDWPLSSKELRRLCEEKYGAPTVTNNDYDYQEPGYLGVAYWEYDGIKYQDPDGNAELEALIPPTAVAISHFEHEERLNDSKRRIKILYPEFLPDLQKEVEYLINGRA